MTKFNVNPQTQKLASLVLGVVMVSIALYHLISHDLQNSNSWHYILIALTIVVGAGIAFPEPVINLIKAWKGKSSE